MANHESLIREQLRTPRAAAIAGILFAVLLTTSQLLVWVSLPANSAARDVIRNARAVTLALNLLPFAGIAFLWFIAALRSRLGALEDKFFATVFLGSGVLYIAMVFTSAAMAGGLIRVLLNAPQGLLLTGAYGLGRAEIYQTMNVYGSKMAGVFMFSTSTILVKTRIVPRWIPFLGYVLGLTLLLSVGAFLWISLVFPTWVFVVSCAFLAVRSPGEPATGYHPSPEI
jgi:hypothetical protein